MKRAFFIFSLICWTVVCQGQIPIQDPVLVKGVILDAESLEPLSATNITVHSAHGRATLGYYTGEVGRFSFFAFPLDTIRFSNVGFKPRAVVIPLEVPNDQYTLIEIMEHDTIILPSILVSDKLMLEDEIDQIVSRVMTDTSFVPNVEQVVNYQIEKISLFQPVYGKFQILWLHHNYHIPKNQWINPWVWVKFINDDQEDKYTYLEMDDLYFSGRPYPHFEDQWVSPSIPYQYEMFYAREKEEWGE
ncbi:hypothetical protein [Persicobacter diffluens]|uniref:hypothetical protein n=1 Tax=Persicobacter diffluens TaxID=981 RepID=UPI0030C67CB1